MIKHLKIKSRKSQVKNQCPRRREAAKKNVKSRNIPAVTFNHAKIKLTLSVSNSRLMKVNKIWRLNKSFWGHALIYPQKLKKISPKTRVRPNLSYLTTSHTASCHTWMTLRTGSQAISNRSILSTGKIRTFRILELKIIIHLIKMSSKSIPPLRFLADMISIHTTRKLSSR